MDVFRTADGREVDGGHADVDVRVDAAAAHHEDVAADPLADVAVLVEEHRPRVGIASLDLAVGQDEVQIVVGLGPRAEDRRRRAFRPGGGGG
jgi:hypothetical protein